MRSSQAAGAKMWSENCLPACCKADQDGDVANGVKIRTETIFKKFLLVIPKFISYCDTLEFFGRLMEHDKGRVELVAQAILKAVRELMETHCEVTLDATINRIVAYRIEEKDEFMKHIYRDAFLVLTQGEF